MSHYRRLLDEIDEYIRQRDARPPATYTPRAVPAGGGDALAKATAAAVSRVTAHVGRYAPYLPLPRSARRMTPQARRKQFAEFMVKATAAYRAGTITADQLARLEARRHHVADALAARGAL